MLGVAAISAGIFSLAVDRAHDREHKWRPVIFGLLTGLTIMGYTLCDGQGVRLAGDKWGYIVWLFVLDTPLVLLVCIYLRGRALLPLVVQNWKVGAIGGALSMAAYGIAIYAMSQAFMAQVAALRETSVIFAAIFSAVILKEHFHPRRYLAVAMVAVGGGAIALRTERSGLLGELDALDLVALLQRVHRLEAVGDLAEHGVIVVEVRLRLQHQEELPVSPVSRPAWAMDREPSTWRCGLPFNSHAICQPGPPVPVPLGQPPCATKPGMTRWNLSPS